MKKVYFCDHIPFISLVCVMLWTDEDPPPPPFFALLAQYISLSRHIGLATVPLSSQESLQYIQSAAETTSQQNVWTGDEVRAWHPGSVVASPTLPPPTLSLSLTLHPLLPSLPHSPLPPSHPPLAIEDGFSESSRDEDQRQITADVYAKCNMETPQLCPHYWFFSLFLHPISLTLSLSPHFSASFLS